jgi:hypothetical protein
MVLQKADKPNMLDMAQLRTMLSNMWRDADTHTYTLLLHMCGVRQCGCQHGVVMVSSWCQHGVSRGGGQHGASIVSTQTRALCQQWCQHGASRVTAWCGAGMVLAWCQHCVNNGDHGVSMVSTRVSTWCQPWCQHGVDCSVNMVSTMVPSRAVKPGGNVNVNI